MKVERISFFNVLNSIGGITSSNSSKAVNFEKTPVQLVNDTALNVQEMANAIKEAQNGALFTSANSKTQNNSLSATETDAMNNLVSNFKWLLKFGKINPSNIENYKRVTTANDGSYLRFNVFKRNGKAISQVVITACDGKQKFVINKDEFYLNKITDRYNFINHINTNNQDTLKKIA